MDNIGINFIFENKLKVPKACEKDECIKDIIIQILKIYQINYDSMIFYYKGIKLKENIKVEYFFNKLGEINIFVFLFKRNNENSINNLITCQKCNKYCLIKFDDFRVNLKDCESKHLITDLSLLEYNSYLLNSKRIIKNNELFLCIKHQGKYCSFCKTCKKNLCINCEEDHIRLKHRIKQFHNILKSNMIDYMEEKQKNIKILKKEIDSLKKDINDIIAKFENVKQFGCIL